MSIFYELLTKGMIAVIYINGEFLPHQAIVFTSNKYIDEFKLEKAVLAYKKIIDQTDDVCRPWEVEIHPVDFCNLKCVGCSYSHRHNKDKIELEKLVKKIELYEKRGLKVIFFSGGGDPCGWDEWERFIDRIKSREWKLGISTNLFSLQYLQNIIDKIDFFQLHIIGYDRKSVYEESGVDAFEILNGNYQNLLCQKKENQSVTMKVLLTNSNYNRIDRYLSYIERFNVDSIVLKMEQDFMRNNNLITQSLISEMRKIIFKHPIIKKFDVILDNLDDIIFNYPKPKHCYIANSGLYRLIRANGQIYPCVAGTFDLKNCINKFGENENENIISNTHFDSIMNEGICPLRACRHYRFNSIIEKYHEREISIIPNAHSAFLL